MITDQLADQGKPTIKAIKNMEGMAEDVQVLLDGLKLANKVKRPVVLKVGDSGLVVDLKKYKAYEGSVPEGGEKAEFTVTLEKGRFLVSIDVASKRRPAHLRTVQIG